jgi:hypothetical protein
VADGCSSNKVSEAAANVRAKLHAIVTWIPGSPMRTGLGILFFRHHFGDFSSRFVSAHSVGVVRPPERCYEMPGFPSHRHVEAKTLVLLLRAPDLTARSWNLVRACRCSELCFARDRQCVRNKCQWSGTRPERHPRSTRLAIVSATVIRRRVSMS